MKKPFKIKKTLLSNRPQKNSAVVAFLSVFIVLIFSWMNWRLLLGPPSKMMAIPKAVFEGEEYLRLFTSILVHANFEHFLSNAIFLGIFSYLLYGYFGFWLYPIFTLIFAVFVQILSLLTYAPDVRLVGASGMVYLMGGLWISLYLFIHRKVTLNRRIIQSIGVSLVLFMPTSLQSNVSYRTHAIGFLLGALLGGFYFLLNKEKIRSFEKIELEEDLDPLDFLDENETLH